MSLTTLIQKGIDAAFDSPLIASVGCVPRTMICHDCRLEPERRNLTGELEMKKIRCVGRTLRLLNVGGQTAHPTLTTLIGVQSFSFSKNVGGLLDFNLKNDSTKNENASYSIHFY